MKKKFLTTWIIAVVLSLILDNYLVILITSNRLDIINPLMIFLDSLKSYHLLLIFLVFFIVKKTKKQITPFILGLLGTIVIIFLLKELTARPRPFEVLNITSLITKTNFSFPSGHTAHAFFPLAFLKKYKKTYYVWLAIAILMGFSRIYLGVHYISDVIVGAFIGLTMGMIILKIYRHYIERHKKQKD